jgi:MerR family transcriptional regulator/heat shock protein HspR
MKMNRKKAYFSISAIAKMFSIHQQTIRLYEKEGLITPKRSEGNTRLFGEEDINRLEEIIYLTHELGINLAGVEMIFKLKKQINKMQKEMNRLFEHAQEELDKETEISKQAIKSSAQKLMKIKQEKLASEKSQLSIAQVKEIKEDATSLEADVDSWEVDYDE